MFLRKLAILMAAIMVMLLTACGNGGTAAAAPAAAPAAPISGTDETIILKAGNVIDINHPYSQAILMFGDIVAERSNGRLEVQLFHSSQLGNEADLLEGLTMGSVEIAAISSAPAAAFVPDIAVFDLPYLFRDRQHVYNVVDGELGTHFFNELQNVGVLGLGWWDNGFRNVTNSVRPIHTPEDLHGIRIRVMENPVPIATFNTIGANAVAMAWGEVFTALQQGAIDAQENPMSVIYLQRLYEVQDYLSLTEHFFSPGLFLMSDMIFQRLSAEDQQIVLEAAAEATVFQRLLSEQQAYEFVDLAEAAGMQVNTVDKSLFIEAMAPVYEQFPQFSDLIQTIVATE